MILTSASQVNPVERILMGPGPSSVPHRILRALSAPTLGHLDPQYLAIMDETCELLRQIFRTQNKLTFPVSGTGMAGMECIAVNLLEPGDEAIVCVNGVFGMRMKDVMERCGATVHAVEAPWGDIISKEQIAAALDAHPKAKLFAIVHAETSTGALQPLEGIAAMCREKGALFVVDAVTSLGGHELRVDDWGIDAIYSGTQKCLVPARTLARELQRPRARRHGFAQDEGAVVVSRRLDAAQILHEPRRRRRPRTTTPHPST